MRYSAKSTKMFKYNIFTRKNEFSFVLWLFVACLFECSNIDRNIGRSSGLRKVFYKALLQYNFLHDAWKIVAVFLLRNILNYPVLCYVRILMAISQIISFCSRLFSIYI